MDMCLKRGMTKYGAQYYTTILWIWFIYIIARALGSHTPILMPWLHGCVSARVWCVCVCKGLGIHIFERLWCWCMCHLQQEKAPTALIRFVIFMRESSFLLSSGGWGVAEDDGPGWGVIFFLNYARLIHGYAWTKISITSERSIKVTSNLKGNLYMK